MTITRHSPALTFRSLSTLRIRNGFIPTFGENALVNFITAFKFFLFETMERIICLNPSLIDDSSVNIEAKELAAVVPNTDVRRWLATRVADKYLRSKTHAAMITKLDKLAKGRGCQSIGEGDCRVVQLVGGSQRNCPHLSICNPRSRTRMAESLYKRWRTTRVNRSGGRESSPSGLDDLEGD